MRLGQRLQPIYNGGVGGETTTQILARVGTIAALNPKPGWCLVQGGSNDATAGITAATTIANVKATYDALLAAGIGVIATTVPPHSAAASLTGAGPINRAIKEYAQTKAGIILVDWYPYLADPSAGTFLVGSDDTIHPNAGGASTMGRALADVLSVAFPPADQLIAANTDSQNLIANGMFVGTAGALGTSTGQLATSWTSRFGANAALSKVARSDGPLAPWQQVALTSPGLTTGDMYVTWPAVAGDVVVAEVEFEIDSGTLTTLTDLALIVARASGTTIIASANRNAAQTAIGNGAITWPARGVLRTAPTTVAVTETGFLFVKFSATAGIARFGRASLKKVA
jgi:lysophospholipase L1-like esterase